MSFRAFTLEECFLTATLQVDSACLKLDSSKEDILVDKGELLFIMTFVQYLSDTTNYQHVFNLYDHEFCCPYDHDTSREVSSENMVSKPKKVEN